MWALRPRTIVWRVMLPLFTLLQMVMSQAPAGTALPGAVLELTLRDVVWGQAEARNQTTETYPGKTFKLSRRSTPSTSGEAAAPVLIDLPSLTGRVDLIDALLPPGAVGEALSVGALTLTVPSHIQVSGNPFPSLQANFVLSNFTWAGLYGTEVDVAAVIKLKSLSRWMLSDETDVFLSSVDLIDVYVPFSVAFDARLCMGACETDAEFPELGAAHFQCTGAETPMDMTLISSAGQTTDYPSLAPWELQQLLRINGMGGAAASGCSVEVSGLLVVARVPYRMGELWRPDGPPPERHNVWAESTQNALFDEAIPGTSGQPPPGPNTATLLRVPVDAAFMTSAQTPSPPAAPSGEQPAAPRCVAEGSCLVSALPDGALMLTGKHYKVGLDLRRGAALFYLSHKDSPANTLNAFDTGRYIQQSFYGDSDGSVWRGIPWRFNPVQGGSWDLQPSQLLNLSATPANLTATVHPRNWAGTQLLTDVVMTKEVTMHDQYVHIRMSMQYNGDHNHASMTQELPAVFLARRYNRLVTYSGAAPWTNDALYYSEPTPWPGFEGQPQMDSPMATEGWAAYEDSGTGEAVGVMSPLADRMVAYRVGFDGDNGDFATSYFSPVTQLGITAHSTLEYDVYVALGTVDHIRSVFASIDTSQGQVAASSRSANDVSSSETLLPLVQQEALLPRVVRVNNTLRTIW